MKQRKLKFKIWDSIANVMYDPFELKEIMINKKAPNMAKHYIYLQFIGLLDKSGKEIYEGDIIKAIVNDEEFIGRIVWDSGCFNWVKQNGVEYQLGNLQTTEIEVIGNIYENPNRIYENYTR